MFLIICLKNVFLVPTALVVVGGANENLLVSTLRLNTFNVDQKWVERAIMVGFFIFYIQKSHDLFFKKMTKN